MRAQAIYELPGNVETRWASPENPTGEKGRAGTAAGGRKGSPTIAIKAGASVVLAEAKNTSAAIAILEMNGEYYPKSAEIDFLIAELCLAREEKDKALQRYKMTLEKAPDHVRAKARIAELEKK